MVIVLLGRASSGTSKKSLFRNMKKPASNSLSSFDRIIITGGTSGIGAALLRQIQVLTTEPAVCNLSRSKAEISSFGERLTSIRCDLTDREQSKTALSECREWIEKWDKGGKILLINNSGFGGYGKFPSPSTDRNLFMLDVNVRAPVWMTGELSEELIKSTGAVINIASTAAFQPTPYLSTYGATKAFVLHWSLGLSEEWREYGVQVLCVCPGPTETTFFKEAGFREAPLKKGSGQTADQVAEITIKALNRGKSLVTCGLGNSFLAALSSKLPKKAVTRMTGMIMRKLRLEQFKDS